MHVLYADTPPIHTERVAEPKLNAGLDVRNH